MTEHIMGNLLIIGGAEDKEKDCKILKYYYREAGEKKIQDMCYYCSFRGRGAGGDHL